MLPYDTQQLLQAGSAGALTDAAAHIRRRVCTDGAPHGADGDFSAPERQWAALIEWAGACGKILPLAFLAPAREGGREHDVTLDESSGRWIKYTKRSASGYTVSWSEKGEPFMHNATPLEYLQRLLWQNEDFGMTSALSVSGRSSRTSGASSPPNPDFRASAPRLRRSPLLSRLPASPCCLGAASATKARSPCASKASMSGTFILPMSCFPPKASHFPSTSSSPALLLDPSPFLQVFAFPHLLHPMPNVSNLVKTIQDIMRKDAGT